jgi:molybdenum cofactor cytidylyltransferase
MAAIILAAGQASRMGTLKQLLVFDGHTLLERAIKVARECQFSPILVVVGAHAEQVQSAIAKHPVVVVSNSQWQSGMGSSITSAMRHLQQLETDSAGVMILLSDQPLVSAQDLSQMKRTLFAGSAPIVAAEYGGSPGVPAAFKRQMFGRLASLSPEAGAKRLLESTEWSVVRYPLPTAAVDIDTPDDFARLTSE